MDVWLAAVAPLTPDREQDFRQVLSLSENRSADRFLYNKDRLIYLHAHVLLRRVLSRYLAKSENTLRFGRGEHGRPYLLGQSKINFNLSHTTGLVACAIFDQEVGVDVEKIRENVDIHRLSQRVFCDKERESLMNDDAFSKFFSYWTLKEAYSKARGLGMTLPFAKLDFSYNNRANFSPDLTAVNDNAKDWQFTLHTVDKDFYVAVAGKSFGQKLRIALNVVNPYTLTPLTFTSVNLLESKT